MDQDLIMLFDIDHNNTKMIKEKKKIWDYSFVVTFPKIKFVVMIKLHTCLETFQQFTRKEP